MKIMKKWEQQQLETSMPILTVTHFVQNADEGCETAENKLRSN